MKYISALIAAVLLLVLAVPASADTLLASTSGAKNLAAAGGWTAWAERAGSRWKLVVRSPGGTVSDARIKTFGAPPDASIGSSGYGIEGKRIVAVYSRCKGSSTTVGCDVYRYDLISGKESRVDSISTSTGSEVAPSIALGQYGFVRVSGPNPGTYTAARRIRRVDTRVALETAVSGSRIAYLVSAGGTKRQVIISQYDASRKRVLRSASGIFSVVITRYRVGWLERAGGKVIAKMTDRIDPSTTVPVIRSGRRALPSSTDSATTNASHIDLYLDAKGVHRAVPPLFT